MFKITKGKTLSLEVLSDMLFDSFNRKGKKSQRYFDKALKKRIEKLLKSKLLPKQRNFFNYLYESKFKNLKEIIKGTPDLLYKHIVSIDNLIGAGKVDSFFSIDAKGQPVSTPFGSSILDHFGYTNFRSTKAFYSIYNDLSRKACSYCNFDNTIMINTKAGVQQALFDLDHYFSKVKYPYLSISLYNLIPSCPYCNSRIKGSGNLIYGTHAHPFSDDIHSNVSFSTSIPFVEGIDFDLSLEQKGTITNDYQKSLELLNFFKIIPRYNERKDEVSRLYRVSQRYPLSKKNEILHQLRLTKPATTQEEVIDELCDTACIPVEIEQAANLPMGKFKLDFADKYNINKWL